MNESMLNRILRARKRQRRMLGLILCLSMLVSLATFAGFHKNAIAKVYTREVLDCPYAHEGAAPVAHTHNDDCYEGDLLVCTLPEREAHMHADACYAELQVLRCGLEESEGHQHTGECFDENGEVICGMEEGQGAHAHSDACFETERVLTCDQPELNIHVHGPECFRTEEITVDEPEETVASEQTVDTVPEMPVSDPNADLETVDDWNREFENLELSGNWARDLVLVAATQQGRGESPNNFEAVLNDASDAWVRHGYTRYGAWYGYPYAEWDAMFVSFCLRYAGIPVENVPNNPTAAFMAESFSMGGLFAGRDYVPAVGDLIFFDMVDDEITNIDHMGIVYHVDAENGTINTVEGDRTDAVATFGYYLNDEQIVGYGILPQNPDYIPVEGENTDNTDEAFDGFIFMTTDEEEEKQEETTTAEEAPVAEVPMPAQSWERTAGGIKVSVEAPEGAFPENTKIAVTPVNGSSLMDTVSDAVNGEVLEVQAVDITFFDANGREIEPAVPIRVVMTPAATEHAEEKTSVVHVDIAQQTAELIEQATGTETDNSEVVFDAEAFTIYAIVYTVDFEYEVNGKTFTSSMPGAEDMPLSEIVKGLGIVGEEELDTFLSKIVSVTSTDEEVAVVTEDRSVRVLKDGDAQIVITMQDGAAFSISVEAEGVTEISDENAVATVSTVNDLYLPASGEVKAELLTKEQGGNAIAAVQTAEESSSYQAFSIALENVDVAAYDGFNVAVTLPEDAVVGRDFQLYQVKEDGTATDITESLTVAGKPNEEGLQNVSGISFTTEDFADFVLSYSIETFYTTAGGDTYRITLNYGPKAGIPDGADLKVKEILPEDESYTNYLNESAAKLGVPGDAVSFARFFDIEIRKDDEKIEPKAPVQVTISLADAPEETVPEELKVLHFAQTGLETIEATQAEQKEGATIDLSFETNGFSVYGVVYTVDFRYEINGKVYDFSIPGGGFISLEHLIEALGIHVSDANSNSKVTDRAFEEDNTESNVETTAAEAESAATASYEQAISLNSIPVSEETRAFVADIETVEFSSPELVWIGRVDAESAVGALKEANGLEIEYSADLTEEQIAEINAQTVEAGDWALVSVRPFLSEESLVVTMKNGDTFTIRVTDGQIRKTVIDARGDTWEITVTYGDDAQIPERAELKVEEIMPENEAYYEYYEKSLKTVSLDNSVNNVDNSADTEVQDDIADTTENSAIGEGSDIMEVTSDGESVDVSDAAGDSVINERAEISDYARFFNIEIWDGEKRIEPVANVSVTIKLRDLPDDEIDDLNVVHFGAGGTEVMKTEIHDTEMVGEAQLSFMTDEFSVYAVVSANNNGNNLGGQQFAIINRNVNEAVLGRTNGKNRIAASSISAQTINGKDYVIADEITLWEFENVSNNVYYLKAPDGKYLNITGSSTATLSNSPQNITITQNDNGLRLVGDNDFALNAWNNNVADGFGGGKWNNNSERFTLYSVNEIIQEQADKISLENLINLHQGETPVDEVIIYTRILNEEEDGYDYYAVAADGSLTRVYDIGDTIGWTTLGGSPDQLKWKLTVHMRDGEPNGYFDFQSQESGKYLIPTEEDGMKDDDPQDDWDLGVNLQGWNNHTYGSTIERWDAGSRTYVGYAYDAVNKKIVPTTDDSQKLEFLFAHVKTDPTPAQLHPVGTLDGKTKGITIKMYDFDGSSLNPNWPPRSSEMTAVMGGNSTGSTNVNGVGYANRGLVSQTLTNGFPIATQTDTSLAVLFNERNFISDASNIFVQQIYDETGYFSYDSSVNYAYLDQGQNKFILYRELAAPEMEANNWTPSGQKGNFFPFDSLQELADQNAVYTNGISVKYDGDLQAIGPEHPQYGQTLYKIAEGSTNNYKSYFFGMTMEAQFIQGHDGRDEHGNEIIYEFNGDDDMWLYIDDRLVLDIGGCHGAVSGTINFTTGEVKVNGSRDQVQTTLREIFQNAGKLPDGTNWTDEGAAKWFNGNTFADYTTHSFKMFYMERGSYASNLKMKFNLPTIEPGSFVLEKKLPDTVQAAYGDQLFAYQIYTVNGNGVETLYSPPEGKYVTYEKSGSRVVPEGSTESAGYKPTYNVGNRTYKNVYFLKAGESIVVPIADKDVRYYVKEIEIDPIFIQVKANQEILEIVEAGGARSAQTSTDAVSVRGRVTYENTPEAKRLLLEKKLLGAPISADDSFRFDVQLEDAKTGQLVPFNQGTYYVVKMENNQIQYYQYENGRLVPSSNNEPVAYRAGISGSIDHIFPGYTILIPGLLPGTDFNVTENQSESEFPKGYIYVETEIEHAGQKELNDAQGTVTTVEGQDTLVRIINSSNSFSFAKLWRDPLGSNKLPWPSGKSITVTIKQDTTDYAKYTISSNDLIVGKEISANGEHSDDKVKLIVTAADASTGYVFTLSGLPYGNTEPGFTYTVSEDTVDGYQSPKYFTGDAQSMGATQIGDGGTICNDQIGYELPSTGGIGTTLFTALGGIMTAAAGAVLALASRRRRKWPTEG